MEMDFDIDHLRAFMVVARKGNISEAARELGATQPNLGRQMTALSRQVGVELFIRHSRGIDLTRQGKEFFELCQNIVGRLAQGIDIICEKDAEPQGSFHLYSGAGILGNILENISSFSKRFPKVSFTFSTIINPFELHAVHAYQLQVGEVDATIMPILEHIPDPDIIQRPLYNVAMGVYASPHYLQTHSTPKSLEDLQFHKIILYESEKQGIELNKPIINAKTVKILSPFMTVGTVPAMRAALINGAGIGCYGYEKRLMDKGLLVDVFPDMPEYVHSYYYTYHKRLEGSPKIEAFYEFLKEVTKIWDCSEKENTLT
ncbi:MAG: LysR family transcriptional regulator [Candidatus Paracaedibacter sp.]